MNRAYADILFTPGVREVQRRMGGRTGEAPVEPAAPPSALTPREAAFIRERDAFHLATVSASGWPYVQFRGGPPGFLHVLDDHTIGYADFRGNAQYISVGNLQTDDRVALLLMDQARPRRLKLLGRARSIEATEDPDLVARLAPPGYPARVERAVLIAVHAYDWNCPQHITPRYTAAEARRLR